MRFTIPNVTGELILTKNESGYQEVLDSFATATSVTVVTYNISKKQDGLLGALRGLQIEVLLISAIPSRLDWYAPSYAGQYLKKNAAAAIELYLQKLAPEEFGPLASLNFCFDNHAKIIMTDTVAYVGSGNFSEESAYNWEAGLLVRDPEMLERLGTFIDEIQRDSVRYYGEKMLESVKPLLAARQRLGELRDLLADSFELVEEKDVKEAVEQLKDAIADSDRAWGEAYEESGPVYSRIDETEVNAIEDWHEESSAVYELEEARTKLHDAESGNIDAGSLRVNNDGNIPDSAFEAVIEDRQSEWEACLEKAKDDSLDLQRRISIVCGQVDEVCREIGDHINRIDNT